jgi:hypothetical protein
MMSVKPVSTEAIGRKTGRSWEEWLAFLEQVGAADLSHKEIARLIKDTGDASGWWAQTITVAFEQHIGRRAPGQMADGSLQVSASRTLPGAPEEIYARLLEHLRGMSALAGVDLAGEPRTSVTDKRRYWRATLTDGSAVTIAVEAKGSGKSLVAVSHEKLSDSEAPARWRTFWKGELQAI